MCTEQISTVYESSETPLPISTCCLSNSRKRYRVCCHQSKLSLANVLLQVISPKCVTITKPVYMQSLAEQFYSTYNGCRYNSLEKTVCQLVYVSWLEILKSSQGAALASPGLTELPSCPVCLERLVCEEGKWEEGQGGVECEGGKAKVLYVTCQ